MAWYSCLLGRYAAGCRQLPKKVEDLERFLAGLDVGDETHLAYFRAIKVLHSFCETRYGVANPARVAIPPKRRRRLPRTLSSAEIHCLFPILRQARDRALVSLLLDTGIRIGEAVGLETGDIGLDSIVVEGKTGQREVPLSPSVRRQLLEIAGDRWVFAGYGGHLGEHQGYNIVRRAFLAAGITGRKLGPHTLRHTFGRHFIMAGGDAFSLQRILGHSNLATTRIYVELNVRDLVRQHHLFTPITAALAPTQGRLIDEAESIIRTMGREEGQP